MIRCIATVQKSPTSTIDAVPELVALDLPVGEQFIQSVRDAWGRGHAVAPIDQRLPHVAKTQLMETLRASSVVTTAGTTQLRDGLPVKSGDALIVATSGSTGNPKAVVHTHHSIRAALDAGGARLGLDGSEHWLLCIPVAHVGGFLLVARHLLDGAPLTTLDRFSVDTVTAAAAAGATHVSLVATALSRIDASIFEAILLGGAAAPPRLPKHVITTYGMTETMGGFAYNGLPLDGVTIEIREGEIFVKGPMLLREYRDGTNPVGADSFLATGDLGECDPNGRLTVHGRRGDLINTGGEKVWPIAVERVLLDHPLIADCAVRGVTDDQWGQRVVAWIVAAGEVPTLDDVRRHIKNTLPAYCAPHEIRSVAAIPRTPLGKVDTPALMRER
jgi:O-succinylbenzoic acid--CoA ligase